MGGGETERERYDSRENGDNQACHVTTYNSTIARSHFPFYSCKSRDLLIMFTFHISNIHSREAESQSSNILFYQSRISWETKDHRSINTLTNLPIPLKNNCIYPFLLSVILFQWNKSFSFYPMVIPLFCESVLKWLTQITFYCFQPKQY